MNCSPAQKGILKFLIKLADWNRETTDRQTHLLVCCRFFLAHIEREAIWIRYFSVPRHGRQVVRLRRVRRDDPARGDTFFNEVTFTGSVADSRPALHECAVLQSATARFLSQDSYTGSAFDPWTQHLYAYCNNNPVNMVDPTGHMAKPVRLPIHLPLPIHLSLPKNSISNGVTPDSENKPVPEFTEKPDNSQIYELIKAKRAEGKERSFACREPHYGGNARSRSHALCKS